MGLSDFELAPVVFCKSLVADLVIAGFAATGAIVKSVFPHADVELPLAEDAIFLALAPFFILFTLSASRFGLGGHSKTLTPDATSGNVPLVTANQVSPRGTGFGVGIAIGSTK